MSQNIKLGKEFKMLRFHSKGSAKDGIPELLDGHYLFVDMWGKWIIYNEPHLSPARVLDLYRKGNNLNYVVEFRLGSNFKN